MSDNGYPWINPVGGYGDALVLSGVLKQVVDHYPARRFNLVRRTRYQSLLEGHEAIASIGHPPKGSRILHTTHWEMEVPGPGLLRPYQILAHAYGLPTPIREKFYVPGIPEEDPFFYSTIPWGKVNVLISPLSNSPRKEMDPGIWNEVVEMLRKEGCFVMQGGMEGDVRIRNTFSLRGLTTPRQLLSLLRKIDLVITVDNFTMHAAQAMGRPAVVIWGPTSKENFGYPGQVHLQAPPPCGPGNCFSRNPGRGEKMYGTRCDHPGGHCTDQYGARGVFEAAKYALSLAGSDRLSVVPPGKHR